MKRVISITLLIFTSFLTAFGQADKSLCPMVNILTVNESHRVNEPVFFIAEVGNEKFGNTVKYNWTVKNAKILSGQGTRIIKTFIESTDTVIADLEITGVPKNCNNVFQETIGAVDTLPLEVLDQFGTVPNGQLRAILDNFLLTLHDNSSSTGVVVVPNNQKTITLIKLYNNHFEHRKFDPTRISFLINAQNNNLTQLYIVPAGADNPTFENSLIIKAADFDKLDKLFRPKPITKKRKK